MGFILQEIPIGGRTVQKLCGETFADRSPVGVEFILPNSLKEAAQGEGHFLAFAHLIDLAYRSL
jgi:hypothetical protein